MKYAYTFLLIVLSSGLICAKKHVVCPSCKQTSIKQAIGSSEAFDSVIVKSGIYHEYDIPVEHPVTIVGLGNPIIELDKKGYGLLIKSDSVSVYGIEIRNVGKSYTKDYAAIYVSKADHFKIQNVKLANVFFGILVEKSHYGEVLNNDISSQAVEEASSGNGIHMWHCSNMQVRGNNLEHLRDGIYFEFVTHSTVSHNESHYNLRYGLHFMFSNNDAYYDNVFSRNGAGVAVMFSKFIDMKRNRFEHNWGTASYGLLLKEIYDATIEHNTIRQNTIGIYAEGSTRITYTHNDFDNNGWAIKISGACYTNVFESNNFLNNSFDVSYNSKLNDNAFDGNYWSSYTGYDLDKDGVGDVPYRPVKLFSYVVNRTPETILLLRSLFVELLNFSEKVSPVFTPDNLLDNRPMMKRIK